MDLAIQKFCGIRQTSPVADLTARNTISAVVCRNVELQFTEKSDNVGIFTTDGNVKLCECGYQIIAQFESV